MKVLTALIASLVLAAPLLSQVVPPVRTEAQRQAALDSAVADSLLELRRQRGDSLRPRPPVSPTGAFFRSLLVPGWGQARLDRNVTAGIFISFEALAAAMVWKSQWQLDFARTRNKFIRSHSQEREDWIVLLVFNHLMAGAEAYVSAHLWDFPPALRIQVVPVDGDRLGFMVSIPLR